ncbi:hypothetical protein SESBI_27447 [Sesbania bispinosa]|nr:hypothetical protein SESBI_27447 [Sesbania bispinosa]
MHGEKDVQSNVEQVGQAREEANRQHPMQDMLNDVFGVFVDHEIEGSVQLNHPNSDPPSGTQNDKIIEHLLEDQECAVTLGVPLKVLAHPDDAIGKVYGSEHSGRVRGLGVGVCPSNVFGLRKHHTDFIKFGSSGQKRIEDLEKHVETLEEKLTGYEETKERLAILENFLQQKFGTGIPTSDQRVPPS